MIRRMFSDLSPEELAVATPDPTRLVSFGEQTKFAEEFTSHGAKSVAVTYEVLVEMQGSYGFGNRVWYRYKDAPHLLIPQFSVTKEKPREPDEPFTDDELAVMRASLPPKPPAIPDTSVDLFERPSW